MSAPSNEEVVREYLDAHRSHDYATLGRLRAPGWVEDWPQTGERVRGHANDEAIMRNWPGGEPRAGQTRIRGSEDRWILTPAWTYQRIVGSGDTWWIDGEGHYPDGTTWFVAAILDVHDGAIHHETWYFGPQLEAPSWRAGWVERIPPGEASDEH
jgi:hypothetical protein